MYNDREAELRSRVDRRRVAIVYAAEGEADLVVSAAARLKERASSIGDISAEGEPTIDEECEVEGGTPNQPAAAAS
jgi:hypothetical protein